MRIVLQLPEVERHKHTRPKRCSQCQGETFQSWVRVERRIKDTKVRTVRVGRYRCTSCKRTFRDYPKGVGPSQQSERLMKLCVIMWSLGLSYRGLAMILSAFEVKLSHMSGWRDVRKEGQAIRRRVMWKSARAVGVDGAWVNGTRIMATVYLGEGQLLSIAEIDEKETAKVEAWLRTLKQRHNIGAIVSDDLAIYKEITDELELGHQICQFHVRR